MSGGTAFNTSAIWNTAAAIRMNLGASMAKAIGAYIAKALSTTCGTKNRTATMTHTVIDTTPQYQ